MGRAKDEGATPASTVPYQEFVCPNGCGRVEKGGKAPFYSQCPSCLKPAGKFLPKPSAEPAPAKPVEPSREELMAELAKLRSQLEARDQVNEGPSAV